MATHEGDPIESALDRLESLPWVGRMSVDRSGTKPRVEVGIYVEQTADVTAQINDAIAGLDWTAVRVEPNILRRDVVDEDEHRDPLEISADEATCPRCGGAMERGYLNAGKGPFRWVRTVSDNATVFGGEKIVRQHYIWGRHAVPAARCSRCQIGVFTYPGADTFGPS